MQVTATRTELSVLMAAARMTLDLLEQDPNSPQAGSRLLADVLGVYDAACLQASPQRTPDPAVGGEE